MHAQVHKDAPRKLTAAWQKLGYVGLLFDLWNFGVAAGHGRCDMPGTSVRRSLSVAISI